VRHRKPMTKGQHIIAVLILLPSLPLSVPLALLCAVTGWLHIGSEWLYEKTSIPFLWINRKWSVYCDERNNP